MANESRYDILIRTEAELDALKQAQNQLREVVGAVKAVGAEAPVAAEKLGQIEKTISADKVARYAKGVEELARREREAGRSTADLDRELKGLDATVQNATGGGKSGSGIAGSFLTGVIQGIATKLPEALAELGQGYTQLGNDSLKAGAELEKLTESMRTQATAATSLDDVLAVVSKGQAQLATITEQVRARSTDVSGTIDGLTVAFNALVKGSVPFGGLHIETTLEAQNQAFATQADRIASVTKFYETLAKKQAAYADEVRSLPAGDALDSIASKLDGLRQAQANLDQQSAGGQRANQRIESEIAGLEKLTNEVKKEADAYNDLRLKVAAQKSDAAALEEAQAQRLGLIKDIFRDTGLVVSETGNIAEQAFSAAASRTGEASKALVAYGEEAGKLEKVFADFTAKRVAQEAEERKAIEATRAALLAKRAAIEEGIQTLQKKIQEAEPSRDATPEEFRNSKAEQQALITQQNQNALIQNDLRDQDATNFFTDAAKKNAARPPVTSLNKIQTENLPDHAQESADFQKVLETRSNEATKAIQDVSSKASQGFDNSNNATKQGLENLTQSANTNAEATTTAVTAGIATMAAAVNTALSNQDRKIQELANQLRNRR